MTQELATSAVSVQKVDTVEKKVSEKKPKSKGKNMKTNTKWFLVPFLTIYFGGWAALAWSQGWLDKILFHN